MRTRDRTGLALAPIFLRLALATTFIWAGVGKFMSRHEITAAQATVLANYGVIPGPGGAAPAPGLPDPEAETAPEDAQDEATDGGDGPISRASGEGSFHLVSMQTGGPYGSSPFMVSGLSRLVLELHGAIHPGLDPENSSPRMRLWPDFEPQKDYDQWPVRMAWAVALTELVGGILIGLGLLTRLGALGVAGVMVGAIWLATIGPALQSGDTVLGFLPNIDPFGDWTHPLLQFTLLCSALALFFTGGGALSLDRLLVGGPPHPAPAKPAAAPAPAKK